MVAGHQIINTVKPAISFFYGREPSTPSTSSPWRELKNIIKFQLTCFKEKKIETVPCI